MSTGPEEGAAWREQLSALADGELDDASSICSGWRTDASVRATWHCYHLIGDVLRSEDLVGSPARDAAVLRRVRERLAQEPVVLAPEFLQRSERAAEPRRGWRAAGAVAAGFVAVAGVYSFMRPAGDPTGLLARVPVASSSVVARADTPSPFIAASQVAIASPSSGDQGLRLVRDARLDAYLAAHKQFAGSSSIGMPSVYVRSSTLETGTSDGR